MHEKDQYHRGRWPTTTGGQQSFVMTSSTFAALLLAVVSLPLIIFPATHAADATTNSKVPLYEYQCFAERYDPKKPTLKLLQMPVGLQVTDHVTHQIMTRIFAIFLREVLNYRNISLIPFKFNGNINEADFEIKKLDRQLELIQYYNQYPDMAMINMAVWMPSVAHLLIPQTIYEAGPSITSGRFGWFVPVSQFEEPRRDSLDAVHHELFMNESLLRYKRYVIDDELLAQLRADTDSEEFVSSKCVGRTCVTLLAEYRYDSAFVEWQIRETGSYVNVLWLGARFREKIRWLNETYYSNDRLRLHNRRFIVLHWMPSDIIDVGSKFRQIVLPRCEEYQSLQQANCKYELTPLLKYYSKSLVSSDHSRLLHALRKFEINDAALSRLQMTIKSQRQPLSTTVYDAVACDWLQQNEPYYRNWISNESIITLSIGGIFPINDTSRGHQHLVEAVRLARQAINRNRTVLANYQLTVYENDGQCKADVVMKAFIHYFNVPNVLGVVGPACSETVEPIAGISRHTNMATISYSAEGASFVDRSAYPFFFRTIGSNRQYEDAYIGLMQHFGWRRVAALTEDGQKYTEYISHMETTLKQHNFELIMNKKFVSDATAAQMSKHLLDLKEKHAKIIIADIHNRDAQVILCEALKLRMTAYEGYVWFLPSWLSKEWNNLSNNDSCTREDLETAFEGHLSIMHTPFGDPQSFMQENITIAKWRQSFNESVSNYIGFAYDAVWAYALAADKLLRENPDAVKNLRSNNVVRRFVDLIWQTDFEGLSGRVRFGQGGSRITDLDIKQWRRSQFHPIGKFHPDVLGRGSNLRTNGGQLSVNDAAIKWLAGVEEAPGDGTYDCSFSELAALMGTDCDNATVVFTAVFCLLAVVVVSLVSFLFWKQRYDSKLRQSAKIMKNFGIDLLSPSRSKGNTLDKWEIAKENVVINRRLGEGAFGTVYGGEAQLSGEGWTAVAVKTLKSGASTEDRLDFLSEAEAMKRLDHKNVVKLLGVCLQSEPIYTIMEFMLYGDLKTYLLARRHMVNDKVGDESDISSKRLTMYAMDVARGLAYLAQQKYVHRDIACRNCLVNAQRVVKLGDFGMARRTFESDYYRFNRKGMLPVRWMAPESLALGMFTPGSDVWAFGVVLYEVITFGSFPYQGLTNNQALEYVKSGKTLQIPAGIKPHLEGLIKACWSQEVKKRPSATEIVEYISNYPRLLTPCLDFPGASVEMPATESDELEMLPKVDQCTALKRDSTLDILAQTSVLNNFDRSNDFSDDMELPEQHGTYIAIPSDTLNILPASRDIATFAATTPDGYSIMSPLLMHRISESSDSSHGRLMQPLQPTTTTGSDVLQQTPF